MRKVLLSLIAFALSVSVAGAQTKSGFVAKKAPMGIMQKSGAAVTLPGKKKMSVPAKITLADNQKIMGPYVGDEVATAQEGLGLNTNQTLSIASMMDSARFSKFNGGKVVSMRYGLVRAATVSKVFIKAIKGKNIVDLLEVPVTAAGVAGWNTVTVETPYTLDFTDADAVLMGFEYKQVSGQYPLSFKGKEIGTLVYGNLGQGEGWYNLNGAGGGLCIQAVVENEYPAYDLQVSDVYSMDYIKAGEEMEYGFTYMNDGIKPLSDYTFGVAIDGSEVAVVEAPTKELSSTAVDYTGKVSVKDLASGIHTFSVYVKTVDGEAVTMGALQTGSYPFGVYTESYPHQKQLIEQFTSTYCTYCPRGGKFLNLLGKKRDDLAFVSLHGNMQSGTDIYTIAAGSEIMSYMTSGFPSAAFNRYPFGDGETAMSIGFNDDYMNQYADLISDMIDLGNRFYPTFATIDLTADYNEAAGTMDIKVSGETVADFAAVMGEDVALTVYITEDSLVSRQLDGSTWKSKYVHNNVLRAVATAPAGDALKMTGNKYENSYSVKVNSKWNKNQLGVVAFIGRTLTEENAANENLWVMNAEALKKYDPTTGISTPVKSAENRPVEFYTIDGVRVDAPVKGLNIVKLSNGETRKVVVK